jgi:heterodisulfide reductase subunit C
MAAPAPKGSTSECIRPAPEFLDEVDGGAELGVSRCYQCRKCTSGCPLTFAMDLMPNQVMLMVQLGMRDEVLGSHTIAVCASCQTCTTRCPNDIDIARLMDALRQLARSTGVSAAEPRLGAFHDAFLGSVRRHGRVYELGMTSSFKRATGDYLDDLGLGLKLLLKGRLDLLPARVRDRKAIRALFAPAEAARPPKVEPELAKGRDKG